MKKKCKVVMLSTNEKAKKGQLVINKELPKDKLFIAWIDAQRSLGYHLYILSDEEIKEGDWQINHLTNKISQRTNSFTEISKEHCSKIVATTDTSLYTRKVYKESEGGREGKLLLPQLPKSFVQAYIKPYNEGKPITEVDLECIIHERYEWNEHLNQEELCEEVLEIKTRPDNTVIVHKSKMYSRDEVIEFAIKYYNMKTNKHQLIYNQNKWIQDNL